MLEVRDNKIVGFGSFEHKDALKAFGCKWDNEIKCWNAPSTCDLKKLSKFLSKVNEEAANKTREKWAQACLDCDVQFCKKGTDDYIKVLERFKELK